jgi:glycosyltransferase involved in cell wall biosynthesis
MQTGVSIVIPFYNPSHFLLEAISSARAQTGCATEVILVNDGTDRPEGWEFIQKAEAIADQFIEQSKCGLASARNAGFRAASCEFVIPLDADDLLDPRFATACLGALAAHPAAAFAYSNYRVFGTENYVEHLEDYDLYNLLDRNVLPYAAVIRRRDWEESGGYDVSMSGGGEHWEFWLRLGERGRFGRHVNQVLFRSRKLAPSVPNRARAIDAELVHYIRQKHPGLYADDARASLKRHWSPAVCIVASEEQVGRQTIRDCAFIPAAHDAQEIRGAAFLVPGTAQQLRPESGELAAIAVWGGRQSLRLIDGSVALSREAFLHRELAPAGPKGPKPRTFLSMRLGRLGQHLSNAGLLSGEAWKRRPLQSLSRLIPLRLKERTNAVLGRQVFDLSFYLQFRPACIRAARAIHEPLCYIPETSRRKRIVFVTPHLGPGGAEAVLLDISASLDRGRCELFLLATQSQNQDWRRRWEDAVDHVYDLQELVSFDKVAAAIYSIIVNWRAETVVVQNSLIAYSILPNLKSQSPNIRTMDLIHSVDEDWDIVAATGNVAPSLDLRVAISESVRSRLADHGIPDSKIRLIRNGVDLQRFSHWPGNPQDGLHRVLFAGRLDPVKRPLLLSEIAAELRCRRKREDFRFVIAGYGSEKDALVARVRRLGLEGLFEFRGNVDDIAPLLGECELVILPSISEGIPLIVLEAFASRRTVVASAVGGVPEVVTLETGIPIPRGPLEAGRFADALSGLIDAPLLRAALAENGRKLVERLFDRHRFTDEYRELLA